MLATILNSSDSLLTAGELHQYYKYLKLDLACSCGQKISKCDFWSPVIQKMSLSTSEINLYEEIVDSEEAHSKIPFILLGKKPSEEYIMSQQMLFNNIRYFSPKEYVLDSSKYVARFLLLNKTPSVSMQGIYLVRDVRGVINSFNKQVQTPKKPLATIVYYLLTNFFAQLVCWTNKDIIKIKYEEFIDNPEKELNRIHKYILKVESPIPIVKSESFSIPHIIGGNRLKSNKNITIKKDEAWKKNIPRHKQILYYLLSLPFMLLNKYKI